MEKSEEICPNCGKRAILLREYKTFDEIIKTYKCLNCNEVF